MKAFGKRETATSIESDRCTIPDDVLIERSLHGAVKAAADGRLFFQGLKGRRAARVCARMRERLT